MNQGKRILVIEDDDETRELMRLALERRGFLVLTAEDGLKGYEQAVSAEPDLIITDISMPAADGVQVVRRVRDTPSIADVPIIVTTGFGSGNATYSLSQGATAYEPKPVDPDSFLSTVERLLERG
ncbi:MAG TPA: response regulator [Pyrinomonadaceae bacterium]|jgi:CheY-like chemotaxis protein|nr:response regulator [Pyrinomonadaceae bacterium]